MEVKIIRHYKQDKFLEELNNFINQEGIVVRDIKYAIQVFSGYTEREALIIYHNLDEFTKEEKTVLW